MNKQLLLTAFFLLGLYPLGTNAESNQATIPEEEISAFESMFGKGPQEEDVYRADRLLISATGSLKPVRLAPSVASVITSEDIENMGARSLQEALETVPGLHVSASTKNAMSPIYSIRGVHTSINPQVLMLLDGVPISAAYYGSQPFFRLPLASVLRIEVIRGPGSALHGADAFAGVINVITKDGQAINGSHVGVRAGSFDSYDTWLQHGKVYHGWDVGFNLEYQESDGDKDRIVDADRQTALDGALGTSASLAPGTLRTNYQTINSHLSLAKDNWTMRLWAIHQDNSIGDGVTQTLGDNNADIDQLLASVDYDKKELRQDLDMKIRLHYNYYKQESALQLFPAGSLLLLGADGNINFLTPTSRALFLDGVFGTPVQIDKQIGIEWTTLYEGFNQQVWRLEVGYKDIREDTEEYKNFGPGTPAVGLPALPFLNIIDGTLTNLTGSADIYMAKQDRQLGFLSIQDEWAFTRGWEFTAGLRYDHYSDFGNTVNPRAALVWETSPTLTSKLLYGRAFRAPSFSELYAQNNPSVTGNPDLEPETIETIELAFDYQPTTTLHATFNVFHYTINDLIELVTPNPASPVAITQNNKNQEGQGFEIELVWEVNPVLKITSNLAYQRSKNQDSGEIVPDAPEIQFYLNPHWTFLPKWSLDGQYFWIGGRHRASSDTRPDIDDYSLTNATIHRKDIISGCDLALSARNIFNADIREPSLTSITNDYPMEGRLVYGELQFHF